MVKSEIQKRAALQTCLEKTLVPLAHCASANANSCFSNCSSRENNTTNAMTSLSSNYTDAMEIRAPGSMFSSCSPTCLGFDDVLSLTLSSTSCCQQCQPHISALAQCVLEEVWDFQGCDLSTSMGDNANLDDGPIWLKLDKRSSESVQYMMGECEYDLQEVISENASRDYFARAVSCIQSTFLTEIGVLASPRVGSPASTAQPWLYYIGVVLLAIVLLTCVGSFWHFCRGVPCQRAKSQVHPEGPSIEA